MHQDSEKRAEQPLNDVVEIHNNKTPKAPVFTGEQLIQKILAHLKAAYEPSTQDYDEELSTAEILSMFMDSYDTDIVSIDELSKALEEAGYESYLQTDFEDPRHVWGLKLINR